jgi:hypothetical protein
MNVALSVLSFVVGMALVLAALNAAIKTVVLPRSVPVLMTGIVFRLVRFLITPWILGARSYEARDRVMAFYAPLSLLALRQIAAHFGIDYDPDPSPDDPISISRGEYDAVYDRLAEQGVPLVDDRHQAWRDFAGWRVNYDRVLLALAALTMAPYAPWSSDRSHVGAKGPPGRFQRWSL